MADENVAILVTTTNVEKENAVEGKLHARFVQNQVKLYPNFTSIPFE